MIQKHYIKVFVQPQAAVISRACVLLHLAHMVHECNRQQSHGELNFTSVGNSMFLGLIDVSSVNDFLTVPLVFAGCHMVHECNGGLADFIEQSTVNVQFIGNKLVLSFVKTGHIHTSNKLAIIQSNHIFPRVSSKFICVLLKYCIVEYMAQVYCEQLRTPVLTSLDCDTILNKVYFKFIVILSSFSN